MIYGIGTDLADVDRIRKVLEKHGDHFAETVLSAKELEIFRERTGKAEFLAGRWAGKEAFSKALGTGIGEHCSFHEIEILPDEKGRPVIMNLYGKALKTVQDKGIVNYHISISHERDYASGFVILEN